MVEGISNAVLEAMALGIPVISSDCGGMTEVINNGVNGFIAPVRDTKALQQTIEDFIGIEKKNKLKIISNAQKTIRENFLLDKQIDNMISFYHNSISKSIHSQI